MSIRIAVDTSFLIFLVKRKIAIAQLYECFDSPVEFYTSRGVLNELHALAKSDKHSAPQAAVAVNILKHIHAKIDPSVDEPDEWLLKQTTIATTDIRLSRLARRKGIKVINITKSNRIAIR